MGPTAERVAANLRELRKARGLDLAGLSARMGDLGQPIGISGLSKIELGQRRVDVDDLMALAVALDVGPARMLLPATATPNGEVRLTPTSVATEDTAWKWATGDECLPVDQWRGTRSAGAHLDHLDLDRVQRFEDENGPHREYDTMTMPEMEAHRKVLDAAVEAALAAEDDGVPWVSVHSYLDLVRTTTRFVQRLRVAQERKVGESDGER